MNIFGERGFERGCIWQRAVKKRSLLEEDFAFRGIIIIVQNKKALFLTILISKIVKQ